MSSPRLLVWVLVAACVSPLALCQPRFEPSLYGEPLHRMKRGDFYGPNGLGAGGGGNNFGFVGSTFNPVLFQGGAVAGGFAKEAYAGSQATFSSANNFLSGGNFGTSYYANTIAAAAASSASALGNSKTSLTYG